MNVESEYLNSAGQQDSRAECTELAEIAVELARESDGARDARETGRHQMVEVAVGRSSELQGPEAYVATNCICISC